MRTDRGDTEMPLPVLLGPGREEEVVDIDCLGQTLEERRPIVRCEVGYEESLQVALCALVNVPLARLTAA